MHKSLQAGDGGGSVLAPWGETDGNLYHRAWLCCETHEAHFRTEKGFSGELDVTGKAEGAIQHQNGKIYPSYFTVHTSQDECGGSFFSPSFPPHGVADVCHGMCKGPHKPYCVIVSNVLSEQTGTGKGPWYGDPRYTDEDEIRPRPCSARRRTKGPWYGDPRYTDEDEFPGV